ncbi:putative RNA-binding protein ARP1 [Cardamine amara subsp. amara]|uniref:RNA-binding protein ARP1 n=1 Tax=Cardamine amara subsp. amara TaxID=228776 RepID=A0ABD1AIM0_CARAN
MAQPNQNLDTTFTKIYVGGLLWTTKEEGLRNHFQQFGEIIHANVVWDRVLDRSQGYGFVTFKDAESATRACLDPYPSIDGRITNCKLASSGANANHNPQPILVRPDDLCWLAPSFWQNLQQQIPNPYQPSTPYTGHYWNQYYQQYFPQNYWYPQQYNPAFYQHCPMVNTNTMHWPNQSDGNRQR